MIPPTVKNGWIWGTEIGFRISRIKDFTYDSDDFGITFSMINDTGYSEENYLPFSSESDAEYFIMQILDYVPSVEEIIESAARLQSLIK